MQTKSVAICSFFATAIALRREETKSEGCGLARQAIGAHGGPGHDPSGPRAQNRREPENRRSMAECQRSVTRARSQRGAEAGPGVQRVARCSVQSRCYAARSRDRRRAAFRGGEAATADSRTISAARFATCLITTICSFFGRRFRSMRCCKNDSIRHAVGSAMICHLVLKVSPAIIRDCAGPWPRRRRYGFGRATLIARHTEAAGPYIQ